MWCRYSCWWTWSPADSRDRSSSPPSANYSIRTRSSTWWTADHYLGKNELTLSNMSYSVSTLSHRCCTLAWCAFIEVILIEMYKWSGSRQLWYWVLHLGQTLLKAGGKCPEGGYLVTWALWVLMHSNELAAEHGSLTDALFRYQYFNSLIRINATMISWFWIRSPCKPLTQILESKFYVRFSACLMLTTCSKDV